jgi:Ca2+/Na+ antiporter
MIQNNSAWFQYIYLLKQIVVALVILKSPNSVSIQINKSIIFRDVGFYFVATIAVLIFATMGEIYLASVICLFALYILLVVIVYFQERHN